MDTEHALVVGSAVSDGAERKAVTLESVQKVNVVEATALATSLAIEWKVALTKAKDLGDESAFESPMRPEYWDGHSRVAKRIISEPSSPAAKRRKTA